MNKSRSSHEQVTTHEQAMNNESIMNKSQTIIKKLKTIHEQAINTCEK